MTGYQDSAFANICRAGIVVFVPFSYPLQILPCRASLTHIFESTASAGQMSPELQHTFFTTAHLLFTFLVALNVTQLDLVLGVCGSVSSTTISFILPALFYIELFP